MLHSLLPLITVAFGLAGEEPVAVTKPRTAQVRLAVTLAEADAIHAVGHRGKTIVFAIDRDGSAFEVVATTRANGKHKTEVIALSIVDVGPAIGLGEPGGLGWLGEELEDATAITDLAVDEDGAVTITTSDGRSYMAIPGRGSGGGNAAVEARWAAAWNGDEG